MQVLFIDILDTKKVKYEIIKNNDFISLKISYGFIELLKNKSNNIFKNMVLNFYYNSIKRKIRKMDFINIMLVYSLILDKNLEYRNLIKLKILESLDAKVYEIVPKNLMEENIDIYIKEFESLKDLKKDKVKLLYFVDEFSELIYKNIIKYINRYKFLDISYLGAKNSIKYENMKEKIENLNNEIGSTISFINPNFNLDYNIYINFSCLDVKSKYGILNDYLIINYYDIENDVLNEFNLLFKNNKQSIERVLKTINLELKDFNINKLGQLVKNKMIKV